MKITNQTFNLTKNQALLWAGQQLNPESPLYNVPYAFEIDGELDTSIFNEAFQKLLNTVEVLRTVFLVENGIPKQYITDSYNYNIELFDTQYNEQEVANFLVKRSQKKFDLSKSLFDTVLIKHHQTKYTWYLNIHHLITDATSSTILFSLMSDIYSGIKNSETIIVANNEKPFKDYITFENNIPPSKAINYWKEKVKPFIETPALFGNKKKTINTKSKRTSITLEAAVVSKIKALTKNPEYRSWTEHLSIFNIFSTVLFAYLYRVSGQKNIAIGAPVHNRSNPEFKNAVGLLMEIFPITAEISEDETFSSLLKRIRIESNEFLKYAETGASSPEVSRSFNTVFNYIHSTFGNFDGIPTKTNWIHPEHCDPAHHLRFHVYDMDNTGEMELVFDANEDVFDTNTITQIPNQFRRILNSMLLDVNSPIEKASLVNSEDELVLNGEKVLYKANSIVELFQQNVITKPNNIAIEYGELNLTFKELDNQVNQLANYLSKNNVKQGDKIALHFYRSSNYIISLLAVLKVGGTYIPIASDQPKTRISFIISNAKCSLILTESSLTKNLDNVTIPVLDVQKNNEAICLEKIANPDTKLTANHVAYILYTSGSTGNPKGVSISSRALVNYISWAKSYYEVTEKSIFPLFTSIGFDLTVTSTLLPLISGGKLVIYKEPAFGPDIALFQVLGANKVNTIKLTPSHLQFLKGRDLGGSQLKTLIVGGEDFKTELAQSIQKQFQNKVEIFNEYGPTEATVGCIVSKYNTEKHTDSSIPIGKPIHNVEAYILDSFKNKVPNGVIGELYIGGQGLAEGYVELPELSNQKFVQNPFNENSKIYHTGDLVRLNTNGELEYLGRVDEQIKLRGFRIELSDIESNISTLSEIENSAVVLVEGKKVIPENEVINCTECGLPSNYPSTDFDNNGVCHVCNAFKSYKEKAQRYFKTENELKTLLTSVKGKNPNYDCISLLSGGKDSTYILAQLIEMGMKVLAFTLDNGYISDQAKQNIDNIVSKLGVDHIYGTTEHMNKIFVDSLQRHHNVCDGCFKTIYTLSTQIALEKQIPFIVTGLSRGQFFETRLTEELFWDENVDVAEIDNTILQARKLYHQEDDAVKTLLDTSAFKNDDTFEKVQFVDFYRYSDVSLEEMIRFLEEKIGWKRPTDTGRSTNCLINQLGIYVHKKQKGYSNYSFPYSWDVRMGHKTRQETLDEINEYIYEDEVKKIMKEIGYEEPMESEMNQQRLVGYYTGKSRIPSKEIVNHLKKELPNYMIPSHFKYVEELPLTRNGKVDKKVLKNLSLTQLDLDTPFVQPDGEIEELIAKIWQEVLNLKQVGSRDDFIALGGHSLAAIRVTARINEEIELNIPLNKVFELPTISEYASYLENTLMELLND